MTILSEIHALVDKFGLFDREWFTYFKNLDTSVASNTTNIASNTANIALLQLRFGYSSSMLNGTLVATVASNNLTVAIKTLAGNDPSVTDPVYLIFRNSNTTLGNFTVITLTAAFSFTVNSGNTLGFANAIPGRLWVVAFNDAGTARLGLINCVNGYSFPAGVYPLYEGDQFVNSTGGNGGNSSGVFYTGTAVTAKPYIILGYLEWNSALATAGTWNATPGYIALFGPGVKKPGDVVQSTFGATGVQSSTTGTSFVSSATSASINVSSAVNPVRARSSVNTGVDNSGNYCQIQLYDGSNAISSAFTALCTTGSVFRTGFILEAADYPGAGSHTYVIKFASGTAGQNAVCGPGTMFIDEIMG